MDILTEEIASGTYKDLALLLRSWADSFEALSGDEPGPMRHAQALTYIESVERMATLYKKEIKDIQGGRKR